MFVKKKGLMGGEPRRTGKKCYFGNTFCNENTSHIRQSKKDSLQRGGRDPQIANHRIERGLYLSESWAEKLKSGKKKTRGQKKKKIRFKGTFHWSRCRKGERAKGGGEKKRGKRAVNTDGDRVR